VSGGDGGAVAEDPGAVGGVLTAGAGAVPVPCVESVGAGVAAFVAGGAGDGGRCVHGSLLTREL